MIKHFSREAWLFAHHKKLAELYNFSQLFLILIQYVRCTTISDYIVNSTIFTLHVFFWLWPIVTLLLMKINNLSTYFSIGMLRRKESRGHIEPIEFLLDAAFFCVAISFATFGPTLSQQQRVSKNVSYSFSFERIICSTKLKADFRLNIKWTLNLFITENFGMEQVIEVWIQK